MDCSAEQEKPVVEDNGGDLGSPELRTVRRRLIQKTLFPHRSQGAEEHIDGREEKDCGADEEEDQTEEYCGSQGKKKKRPKRKAMSRPRASKKLLVEKERRERYEEGIIGKERYHNSMGTIVLKHEAGIEVKKLRVRCKSRTDEI
ncbi:hypothetical protein CK203_071727 [Vitis vinifera]|uniref:Uncharacterized protein n=1 Tax=Vitis vinifera TaxID=29760 RepID=A0A438C3Q2_VITVI|nr:hypothetical protein CK203_071727 [Vitis vinifera]